MKKVLFATTALGAAGLIVSADMAAAQDVSFGGYGRFGLFYQENDSDSDETRIEQRFRLTITATTTTDAGLEVEGRIRLQTDDQGSGASNTAQTSAAGFAVSTGGFRLDVGHVSDVIDSGDVLDFFGYEVGLTDFVGNSTGSGGIPASGFGTSSEGDTIAPTVKLRYNFGDFTVAASYTDDADTVDSNAIALTQEVSEGANEYQIGVGYNFGNYSVGAAYGEAEDADDGDDNEFFVLGFGGELGAFAFNALVYDSDIQDDTGFSLTAKYDIGAATDIRFVYADGGIDDQDESYGIGFRHSLGGGVVLRGGIGEVADSDGEGQTTADIGIRFDF